MDATSVGSLIDDVNDLHNHSSSDGSEDDANTDNKQHEEEGLTSFLSLSTSFVAKKSIPPKDVQKGSHITTSVSKGRRKPDDEKAKNIQSLGKRTRERLKEELSKRKKVQVLDDKEADYYHRQAGPSNETRNIKKTKRSTGSASYAKNTKSSNRRRYQERRKESDDDENLGVVTDRWLPPHYVDYYLSKKQRQQGTELYNREFYEVNRDEDEDDEEDDPTPFSEGNLITNDNDIGTNYVVVHGIPLEGFITEDFVKRSIFRGLGEDIEDVFTLYPLKDALVEELDVPPVLMENEKGHDEGCDISSSASSSGSSTSKEECSALWGWNESLRAPETRSRRNKKRKRSVDGWIVPRVSPMDLRLVVKFKSITSAELATERSGELVSFANNTHHQKQQLKVALLIAPLQQRIGHVLHQHLSTSLPPTLEVSCIPESSSSSKDVSNGNLQNESWTIVHRLMWCYVAYMLNLKKIPQLHHTSQTDFESSSWKNFESFFWDEEEAATVNNSKDNKTSNKSKGFATELEQIQYCRGILFKVRRCLEEQDDSLLLVRADPPAALDNTSKEQKHIRRISNFLCLTKSIQEELNFRFRRTKALLKS